jgi:hypothetical protein
MGSNLSQNDDGFGNGIPFVMKIEGVTAVPEASALVVWSVMFSVVAAVWSLQRLKQAAAAA